MREDRFFVDTNLLLYSIDARAGEKREQAVQWIDYLWSSGAARLSWQVLHEFHANAVRKFAMPPPLARNAVAIFSRWEPVEMTLGLIERGWYWMDQAQVSYWDSLILSAAERSACAWLLSEDFQPGRCYESVTVINPFLKSPSEFSLKPPAPNSARYFGQPAPSPNP